jgi:nitroreductase
MIFDLVMKSRSYRRFDQTFQISEGTLIELVKLARLSPTASNLQPLKFLIACNSQMNNKIFSTLGWAGYLKDWGGPIESERPTGYIIILGDKKIKEIFGVDYGIAAQTMMLGAVEKGLGGCMITTIKREALMNSLNINEQYEILMILALGKPVEEVVITAIPESGDIRYYRSKLGIHHVPKRSLEDLIVK